MTQTTPARPVSVDELRRAWVAVRDGQFAGRPERVQRVSRRAAAPAGAWAPTEPVLPVMGCIGQAGASTLALAIATAASPARVLECSSATASGLAIAATAELGTTDNTWTVGRREQVWIGRTTGVLLGAQDVPVPDDLPATITLTVLDVGWEAGQVMAADSWIRDHILNAQTVITVTAPTIPGLRRLETALTLLGASRVFVVVVGAARRRWPRHLAAAMGRLTAGVDGDGRLVTVPTDSQLALRGLGSTPLPTCLLEAAQALLGRAAAGDDHTKGQSE